MTDSSRPTDTPRRVVRETPARQGRYGRHMMWVLLGGLFLVIAAFAALYAYRASDFNSANANNGPANIHSPSGANPAQVFKAPEPAPLNPPPGTDHTAPGPAPRSP
jgi:hypothetical protein